MSMGNISEERPSIFDGFGKSPSAIRQAHGPEPLGHEQLDLNSPKSLEAEWQSRRAALRFVFRHCGVLYGTT